MLRSANGTELDFHRVLLQVEPDDVWLEQACQELGYDIEYIAQFLQDGEYPQELLDKIVNITGCNDLGKIRVMLDKQKDGVCLDDFNGCLLLAYKTLVWMGDEDPGGTIFSQRMLSQNAELVVDNMVRELMLSSCEPPLGLDPEHLLQRHRQLLLDDWSQSDSPLCQSFDEHLRLVSKFSSAPAEVGGLQQESTWAKLYKQDVCQQVVTTHYEIVRGLALALALVDYHHKATGDDRLDDDEYERIRKKLDREVLPLLSSYHMLMWSARRPLVGSTNVVKSSQPAEWQQLNTHRTLLSLCVEADGAHDAARELVGKAFWELHAFRALRREAAEDEALKAQWKVLLMLCDHPTTSISGEEHRVAFVRGCSCLYLSRWKEATTQFASVLRGSRALIAGGAQHRYLITLQEELANKYEAPRGHLPRGELRQKMRTLLTDTQWGPVINNMLDYFVLLHHYRGSEGLIHSLLKLLRDRAGLCGQRDWQENASAERDLKGGVESFCTLMHLAMDSLHDLRARLDSIERQYQKQGNPNAECLFAVDCFRYLIVAAEHYLRVSWLTMYTDCGLLDEAYDLIAESIALCSDDDISKVRSEDISKVRREEVRKEGFDEYTEVEQWLDGYFSMDVETYNRNHKPKGEMQENLRLRSRSQAYKCLEQFVSAKKLQAQPDKLCSYPWINCSHTVDTLLRERCESKERLIEAYHVRYAFNVARSDYRTAGDVMMTYWFNNVTVNLQGGAGIGGIPEVELRVKLDVLQEQANAILAAINCYSLIDERFAFWIPPSIEDETSAKKRQTSELDGSAIQAPEVITLPMMQQHYALLRARIRLAEMESLSRSKDAAQQMHRMVLYDEVRQQGMAEDTVAEMLKVGLLDDAISLAAAFCPSSSSSSPIRVLSTGVRTAAEEEEAPFSLATEDLCRELTKQCLRSPNSQKVLYMVT